MSTPTIAVLVGSARTGSLNQALAHALARLAEGRLKFDFVPLTDLPMFNGDIENNPPAEVWAYKTRVEAADGLLFVTPEYNRSIPGGLKNAIDWASRPYGSNAFARKPAAVIGTSPGAIGTAIAQQSLRSVLGFLNAPQMNAPEAYIQFKPGLITDDGDVTVPATEEFLRQYMEEFHLFIARVTSVLPRDA